MPERFLGRTLGKYRLDTYIGSGGFAWVYRGVDPDLELPVAVKVLKPQYAGDPAFEERFRREASTAARLRHPHVVTIYAVGRDGDAVYFAMDYLPHSLGDRLARAGTLPEPAIVRGARDVASALGFAHREGIIHRDVKPDNILFDDHGNAIVVDFGIARAVASHAAETGTQMVVGTPHYFAPEQARGWPLDGRADLYALGVTLYQAAAGVLPFPGDDWFDVARQHVEAEPVDVRVHNPALSRELARVIHRCLEKRPEDRFESAEALCAALDELPRLEDTTASRTVAVPALDRLWTTTGVTARRRRLRRRVLWGVGALGTVGVVALAGLALSDGGTARAETSSIARIDSVPIPQFAPPGESLAVAGADSLPPADSVVPAAAPSRGRLSIAAPDEARVYQNGQLIGTGALQRELAPGRYELEARTIDAPAACPSARKRQTVVLGGGDRLSVRLAPVGCGRLVLKAMERGAPITASRDAVFTLSGGPVSRSGGLPVADPLVLPAGSYDLAITAPNCYPFTGRVEVEPNATTAPRIVILCPGDR